MSSKKGKEGHEPAKMLRPPDPFCREARLYAHSDFLKSSAAAGTRHVSVVKSDVKNQLGPAERQESGYVRQQERFHAGSGVRAAPKQGGIVMKHNSNIRFFKIAPLIGAPALIIPSGVIRAGTAEFF